MSQKINSIIFSQDRPAQLKLFLDSVEKNAQDIFELNVIISHTSEEFYSGYDKVIKDPVFGGVKFYFVEPNFKEQVLNLITSSNDYFTFFLDDDIIYNKINLEEILSQMELDDDLACFSLRLGENTTNCYTLKTNNVLHDMQYVDNIMKWDWSLHYLDFGYPFAMDGHIFRKSDIYKLVKKSNFNNVEELEMALFDFAEIFPRNKMVSYRHSALVGVPITRVQESIDNEMTIALRESRARVLRSEINTKFLNNDFISLENIDFSEINGCHQDLNIGIELKKEENE